MMADPAPVIQVNASAANFLQLLSNFDFSKPETLPTWKKRSIRYLNVAALSAKPAVEKIDLLLYAMGEKSEEIFMQVMPQPHGKSFQDVIQAFTDYFEPKKNVVFERSRFNSRSQLAGETVDQYVTALHVMAEKCNYGQLRDELIRDRIVMGLTDTRTKERLQLKSDLTLDSTVTIARQTEDQRRQVKSLPAAPEVIDINRVKVVTGGSQPTAPKGRNTDYLRCGLKFHRNNKCPALTSKCRNCGKIGHWDKVCRSKSVNLAQAATSEVTEEEEEETSKVHFLENVSQSGSNNDFDVDAFIDDFQ